METLPERVRKELSTVHGVVEKRMFGSVAFMIDGKLCLSARETRLMCRVGAAAARRLVKREGCRPMEMNGRKYRDYVHVDGSALKSNREISFWVRKSVEFNRSGGKDRNE